MSQPPKAPEDTKTGQKRQLTNISYSIAGREMHRKENGAFGPGRYKSHLLMHAH